MNTVRESFEPISHGSSALIRWNAPGTNRGQIYPRPINSTGAR